MLNKNLVALWSISLLALCACTIENAGASIDPPAMAYYTDPESSSSIAGTSEELSSSGVKVVENYQIVKGATVEVTIVKTHFEYVASETGNSVPTTASSSSTAIHQDTPSGSESRKTKSVIAYCNDETKKYKVEISLASNDFIEKTLTMDNFGSSCATIFNKFKDACISEVEIKDNSEGCDENGSISATCTYSDDSASIDALENELSDTAISDCSRI